MVDKVRGEFAKRIVERMHTLGWNQSELGRRAGIGRDNVSGYVRGKNLPNSHHLEKLAAALRVQPSYLLGAAYEERFPALAEDGREVFRSAEIPDQPGYMMVEMKKPLSVEQYRQLLDWLSAERRSKK